MVKVAVAGARGRMGSRIAALCMELDGLELAGAFEIANHPEIGRDMGELLGTGANSVALAKDVQSAIAGADVLVDFTQPSPTIDNLRAVVQAQKAIVIGTTGFTKQELNEAHSLAKKIPCVMAGNMSLGINLLLKVLGDVGRALGDDYDIEIIEAHHKMKKDAPSGTALMLAGAITEAIGRNLEEVGVYSRHGMIGERAPKEIGIQTIRGGDIVGEHTVMFCGMGERIEITHKASSRDTFARGALRAARWIQGKDAGLYNMKDVLGL